MSEFPPVHELVPHTGSMVLLDRMVEWDPGYAVCDMLVRRGVRFVESGGMPTLVTIEHMGQCVAACLGYEAFIGGEGTRVGMIIAARRFETYEDTLGVGTHVRLEARRIRGNEMLSHFECTARVDDRVVSEGVLTVFHAEEPPE